MVLDRSSGILLHITSLPSRGGIGDFGPEAYAFADFLAQSQQRLWQVLPLGPTGFGNSPYAALSAFAGNPLLISLEKLAEQGWLASERLQGLPGDDGPVDYDHVAALKLPLLEEAAGNFLDHADPASRTSFEQFCRDNTAWLADYAMYNVLRRMYHAASWNAWPEEYLYRRAEAMETLRHGHGRALAVEQAIQFFFDQQWCALRSYCAERGIRMMGDVAIFVNYDSADVWTHPELFELDEQRQPIHVAGVPPDYFSETGQRWGNPLYRWGLLAEHGFDWWVARIRRSLALYDVIRLDHFRGFEAYWSIPAAEETAVHGQWVKAPGAELFARLTEAFGELPFVAEDLGLITQEVDALRERFGFPGMRILQFGFGDKGAHIYLPHRFVPNSVVYTGTHDNDTTLGWWQHAVKERERAVVESYLQPIQEDAEIVWAMMRAAARSVANLCIFPMQDVLGVGSEGRMNVPSRSAGNWGWRYAPGPLQEVLAVRLAALTEVTDRDLPRATENS
jgi:4-alpha-glucanotransferase